jgi:hypothetical protein
MEGAAGVTEIEDSTAAVTVRVVEPLTVPDFAVIVDEPFATPVAKPPLLIVAIEVADEVQVTLLVRFCVVWLVYVPVAVNCWVLPAAIDGDAGVTAIEVNTAAVTVSVVEPLTVPDLAVMVADPCATPVAKPPLLMVAIAVVEEVQVALPVRFCVVPLL